MVIRKENNTWELKDKLLSLVIKDFGIEAKILKAFSNFVYEKFSAELFTTEEKTELVAAEQEKMKETAEADENLKRRAEERAKKLLENYVINVGNSIGQTYTVEFKNAE